MQRLNLIDWIGFILVIIGALFWGLVGIMGAPLLTSLASLSTNFLLFFRIVWLLVGLAGLWIIYSLYKMAMPAMRERMMPSS